MPSKRKARRGKVNHDIDKRKLWKKLKKRPVLKCKEISAFWDKTKTLQQNLKDMGLAYDANRSVQMPGKKPAVMEEMAIKPKVPEVLESMETEVALGEKEKRFLISGDDVLFCTHMMDTYKDNYKAMARDKRNYFQLTPKQIRDKIRSFKRSKTQYQAYLDAKKRTDGMDNEIMES